MPPYHTAIIGTYCPCLLHCHRIIATENNWSILPVFSMPRYHNYTTNSWEHIAMQCFPHCHRIIASENNREHITSVYPATISYIATASNCMGAYCQCLPCHHIIYSDRQQLGAYCQCLPCHLIIYSDRQQLGAYCQCLPLCHPVINTNLRQKLLQKKFQKK